MAFHHALTDPVTIHEEKHARDALFGTILQYQGDRTARPVQGHLGAVAIAIDEGDEEVTLGQTELSAAYLSVTGVLTAAVRIIVPNAWGPVVVSNETTGAFTVTVSTEDGTGVPVTQEKRCLLMADDTNVVRCAPEV